jgi:hypothetical protein
MGDAKNRKGIGINNSLYYTVQCPGCFEIMRSKTQLFEHFRKKNDLNSKQDWRNCREMFACFNEIEDKDIEKFIEDMEE